VAGSAGFRALGVADGAVLISLGAAVGSGVLEKNFLNTLSMALTRLLHNDFFSSITFPATSVPSDFPGTESASVGAMLKQHKILLLDDDQDILDLYKEMLASLPSQPEVQIANSGARAIALLEGESFSLLISDLKMPKMDGLQLLTIVRKRWPSLRTVVMSALTDEQFKHRAYAMGIDQFLEKPRTGKEINYFCECIEGLLNKGDVSGAFRGVQSKSLMDIIQLECLSQSSSVLKIIAGPVEGRIWIDNGEVIDSVAADATGEEAFRMIASWKGGNFEILPADPGRKRTIHHSYHALLLETAQAIDEAQQVADSQAAARAESSHDPAPSGLPREKETETADTKLYDASRIPGVEFLVATDIAKNGRIASWGLENPDQFGDWVVGSVKGLGDLGERCHWGEVRSMEGKGIHGNIAVMLHKETAIGVGWERSLAWSQVRDGMKKILARWIS
jgi:CheY-like chemotaxis protein